MESALFPSFSTDVSDGVRATLDSIFAVTLSMSIFVLARRDNVPTLTYERRSQYNAPAPTRFDVVSFILDLQHPTVTACRQARLLVFNGHVRWNTSDNVYAQINQIIRTMTLALATKRTLVLSAMAAAVLQTVHGVSSCTLADAGLSHSASSLLQSHSESDAFGDIRVVTMSSDVYDVDLLRHVEAHSCDRNRHGERECDFIGVDSAIALAAGLPLARTQIAFEHRRSILRTHRRF